MLRKIIRLHRAEREDIGHLITHRVLPSSSAPMGQFEPFLFLNHHGPQHFGSPNPGLPFAPHPHRGFETVTFIRRGELLHRDSTGFESVITAGGIQWMTAGRGIIHEEISSDDFKKAGGEVEILQLWVNLPSRLKMSPPAYYGAQRGDIKRLELPNGQGHWQLVSGRLLGETAHYSSLSDVTTAFFELEAGATLKVPVPTGQRIFCYPVEGTFDINGQTVRTHELPEFELGEGDLELKANTRAAQLLCLADPIREPIAAYGPFVMNTRAELEQAVIDYQSGRFTSR